MNAQAKFLIENLKNQTPAYAKMFSDPSHRGNAKWKELPEIESAEGCEQLGLTAQTSVFCITQLMYSATPSKEIENILAALKKAADDAIDAAVGLNGIKALVGSHEQNYGRWHMMIEASEGSLFTYIWSTTLIYRK